MTIPGSTTITGSRRLIGKSIVIVGLTCVILIALYMVASIIDSRQNYRDEAARSIAESYAGPQTLVGPILVQPYTQIVDEPATDAAGKLKTNAVVRDSNQITFPTTLKVDGNIVPSVRHHGLYKTAVYLADAQVSADVDVPESTLDGKVNYHEPYLAIQLSDVRGIVGMPAVTVNGTKMVLTQGGTIKGGMEELTAEPRDSGSLSSFISERAVSKALMSSREQWQPNLRVRLLGAERGKKAHYHIEMSMHLAGTQRLSLAPVGDLNEIALRSTWPSPLFAGRFLPRTPEVSSAGFNAAWSLSSLAAATQQQIISGENQVDALNVSLLTPIDPYKLSDRAVKYGILFVMLTFGGFFMFELMKKLPIHPLQYLLVGLGLTIFFLLLISFSEHMTFGLAYLLSSVGCIGLLSFYLIYVLRSLRYGLGFGTLLTFLYGCIYGLLVSEDNALLLGSLLLFFLLGVVMYVTRKVDWYKGAAELAEVRTPVEAPPPLA